MNANKVLLPNDVRKLLNVDNKEIVELCKKTSVTPRKDHKGQIYFSVDEVKKLRNAKSSVIKLIDEKLEGMDDVVLELVRCKTENENLKNKVNELNKENFKLKNVLNSFKPLLCGFYIKKKKMRILCCKQKLVV